MPANTICVEYSWTLQKLQEKVESKRKIKKRLLSVQIAQDCQLVISIDVKRTLLSHPSSSVFLISFDSSRYPYMTVLKIMSIT